MKNNKNIIRSKFLIIISSILGLIVILLIISLFARYIRGNHSLTQTKQTEISGIVKVNILNGTTTNGLAKVLSGYLKNRGYDIVQTGNHPDLSQQSIIIYRKGHLKPALSLSNEMGIPKSQIREEKDTGLYVQCTVIIGEDYKILKPFKK